MCNKYCLDKKLVKLSKQHFLKEFRLKINFCIEYLYSTIFHNYVIVFFVFLYNFCINVKQSAIHLEPTADD